MKTSIITPWSGSTSDLLADYFAAVQHADQVVTVDNASAHTTASDLVQMHEQIGGEYIRNAENRGFAAANNQGYAVATGDVIVFLNSDIAAQPGWLKAVAADVKDGGLYGPSLQQQLVYGMWLPYVEGWCIAATRATWGRLGFGHITQQKAFPAHITGHYLSGPWDEKSYPGPYWEDTDLCLRALEAGVTLVQTAWPVQHKGGRTAGSLIKHGASFERNRATFAARVRSVWEAKMSTEG
jgi:glycosyltransferase involved in cell wall biosynthesis